jgi:hypothetical protein
MGEKWPIKFSLTITTSTEIIRDFLHAANLQHGTEGFTSPPKEGMVLGGTLPLILNVRCNYLQNQWFLPITLFLCTYKYFLQVQRTLPE